VVLYYTYLGIALPSCSSLFLVHLRLSKMTANLNRSPQACPSDCCYPSITSFRLVERRHYASLHHVPSSHRSDPTFVCLGHSQVAENYLIENRALCCETLKQERVVYVQVEEPALWPLARTVEERKVVESFRSLVTSKIMIEADADYFLCGEPITGPKRTSILNATWRPVCCALLAEPCLLHLATDL
jgi:hypothetical protein